MTQLMALFTASLLGYGSNWMGGEEWEAYGWNMKAMGQLGEGLERGQNQTKHTGNHPHLWTRKQVKGGQHPCHVARLKSG